MFLSNYLLNDEVALTEKFLNRGGGYFMRPYMPRYEDREDDYLITYDVPGVEKENISVFYENRLISIDIDSGGNNVHREIGITSDVAYDKITAEIKNGQLLIVVPKHENAKRREIQIK